MLLPHSEGRCVDVRSPGEYGKGHIPGAINIPLLDDIQRAAIGTCFKEKGQNEAVKLGFKLAGPFFYKMVEEIEKHPPPIFIYCWRGGLRSKIAAWIFETAGINVSILSGGYKKFRKKALQAFEIKKNIQLLGGLTGSGKTERLNTLEEKGEQVLNLEALARHRGSSFGIIGMPPQPTCEQFENEIAVRWTQFSDVSPIWIEDEGRMIGQCRIPDALYKQMKEADLIWIDVSREERLNNLIKEYGRADKKELIAATVRLQKRLGCERTKEICLDIDGGNLREAFSKLLDYYDKTYLYQLHKRTKIINPGCNSDSKNRTFSGATIPNAT